MCVGEPVEGPAEFQPRLTLRPPPLTLCTTSMHVSLEEEFHFDSILDKILCRLLANIWIANPVVRDICN